MLTKKDLNKLSKEQLKQLAFDVLNWHEKHYIAVENQTESLQSAFFQFAGNIKSIRDCNNLPKLY